MNKLILTLSFGILASSAFAFTEPPQRERQNAVKSAPADNFFTDQPQRERRDAVKSTTADNLDNLFTDPPQRERRDAMMTTKRS